MSQARNDCTDREIWNLLKTSAINNQEAGITGCLIYHNQTFVQILEGPKYKVTALMEKIRLDIRHSKIKVVHEESCEERTFSEWAMGYLDSQAALDQDEIDKFENRILELSRLYSNANESVRMFWVYVAMLMDRTVQIKAANNSIIFKLQNLRKINQ